MFGKPINRRLTLITINYRIEMESNNPYEDFEELGSYGLMMIKKMKEIEEGKKNERYE